MSSGPKIPIGIYSFPSCSVHCTSLYSRSAIEWLFFLFPVFRFSVFIHISTVIIDHVHSAMRHIPQRSAAVSRPARPSRRVACRQLRCASTDPLWLHYRDCVAQTWVTAGKVGVSSFHLHFQLDGSCFQFHSPSPRRLWKSNNLATMYSPHLIP